MARVGATPEELTALKGVFDTQSQVVDNLQSTITSRLSATDWQGPARERFDATWSTEFKPALQRLQVALQDLGREAHQTGERIRAAGS